MRSDPERMASPEPRSADVPASEWQDELTGLPGPRFWIAILHAESARGLRYRRRATVVLVAVVGLDALARNWGDDIADQALVTVARLLDTGRRSSDYVARLDDSTFGLVLPETDEVAAINFVERIRDRCDRAFQSALGARVAFGWASPTGGASLVDAAESAAKRLQAASGD